MTQPLTEQMSLRLTAEQRDYLRGQVEALKSGHPPYKVCEADVVRALITWAARSRRDVAASSVEAAE